MTEISPKFGEKFYRPMVEIFAGIPSVVYGWVGLTVLIPFLKKVFDLQVGHSILAASLVLSIMIFPSISSVASDAIRAVSKETRMAAYGLGSTRWQTIYRVVIPAALPGVISGIVLGLARAFGEALAVAMVIGQTTALPKSIFLLQNTNNGNCSSNGKCDGRWRNEGSPMDNGFIVVLDFAIVYYCYS